MKNLLIASALILSANVHAQSILPSWDEFNTVKSQGRSAWQLTIDNDSLLFKKDDGFYTSGNQLSQRHVLTSATQSTAYGWTIGQELYTASDINIPAAKLSPRDHPYAGWLDAGVFKEVESATGQSSRLSLDIGCLGPCAGGERTQNALHRFLRQPLPQAWSTELRNEWGAIIAGEYSPGSVLPLPNTDITPRLKARFGNIFTDAAVEVTTRFGRLNNLPLQAASYGFLRVEVKAVAYNATLQGGYFNDQKTGVHPKTSVGEIEIGYLWRTADYGLSASFIRRSNEIKELSNGVGAQNFARIQLFYTN